MSSQTCFGHKIVNYDKQVYVIGAWVDHVYLCTERTLLTKHYYLIILFLLLAIRWKWNGKVQNETVFNFSGIQ